MNRPEYSPAQNFAMNFISNVGCASVYQMAYILHRRYGATLKETLWCLRDFEGEGICHFDKDEKVVVAGKSFKDENPMHKLERNTLMALAVAINTIEDPSDYGTIYVPHYGENLRFMNGDNIYGVLVSKEDSTSNILYYQGIYTDKLKTAKNKKQDMEMFENSYSKLLITYPLGADKKAAFQTVESLDLEMPHAIVFLGGKSIYEEIKIQKIDAK